MEKSQTSPESLQAEKKCAECGGLFRPYSSKQIYCRHICYEYGKSAIDRKRYHDLKNQNKCPRCGGQPDEGKTYCADCVKKIKTNKEK